MPLSPTFSNKRLAFLDASVAGLAAREVRMAGGVGVGVSCGSGLRSKIEVRFVMRNCCWRGHL